MDVEVSPGHGGVGPGGLPQMVSADDSVLPGLTQGAGEGPTEASRGASDQRLFHE